MKIETPEQLQVLLDMCHKNRVSSIAVDGIVMQIHLRPEPLLQKKQEEGQGPVIFEGMPLDADELAMYEEIKRTGTYQKNGRS